MIARRKRGQIDLASSGAVSIVRSHMHDGANENSEGSELARKDDTSKIVPVESRQRIREGGQLQQS